MKGDAPGAVEKLKAELAREGGKAIDTHLLMAEALWQVSEGKGSEEALRHYVNAALIAVAAKDTSKEGMIALGHGFALQQMARPAAAKERLARAKELAEADGNANAAAFAQRMLDQVGSMPESEEETTRATWRQFAEAMAAERALVLFLRGTLAAPLDVASQKGISKLRSAGCAKIEFVDVTTAGPDVPEGLQGLSNSKHLEFPQLFVRGGCLSGFVDLPDEELREKLAAAEIELGEPQEAEPCHGTAAFSEGLEPWEVALVEIISQDGAGDWREKAAKLAERGHMDDGKPMKPGEVETAWERLAPLVKDKLETQPEMPCGHSCNTCPTRHSCQLHEAVDDKTQEPAPEAKKVADIEDF